MYASPDKNYSVALRLMAFDSMSLFAISSNSWIICLNKIDENWHVHMQI